MKRIISLLFATLSSLTFSANQYLILEDDITNQQIKATLSASCPSGPYMYHYVGINDIVSLVEPTKSMGAYVPKICVSGMPSKVNIVSPTLSYCPGRTVSTTLNVGDTVNLKMCPATSNVATYTGGVLLPDGYLYGLGVNGSSQRTALQMMTGVDINMPMNVNGTTVLMNGMAQVNSVSTYTGFWLDTGRTTVGRYALQLPLCFDQILSSTTYHPYQSYNVSCSGILYKIDY